MSDLLQKSRDLKTKAKNERDSGLYVDATRTLTEAIGQLDRAWQSASAIEAKTPLAAELADCHGMLGGVQLRWGLDPGYKAERSQHLLEAIEAYDKGFEYESAEENRQANSYNLVNQLVARILYDPNCLSEPTKAKPPADIKTLDVHEELEKAAEVIRQQLRIERRGDVWALADLAIVNVLLDRQSPISAYSRFNSASPPDYAYVSVLSMLKMLADIDPPLSVADKLHEAVDQLEDQLRRIGG